jgi:hypothetical protein
MVVFLRLESFSTINSHTQNTVGELLGRMK